MPLLLGFAATRYKSHKIIVDLLELEITVGHDAIKLVVNQPERHAILDLLEMFFFPQVYKLILFNDFLFELGINQIKKDLSFSIFYLHHIFI